MKMVQMVGWGRRHAQTQMVLLPEDEDHVRMVESGVRRLFLLNQPLLSRCVMGVPEWGSSWGGVLYPALRHISRDFVCWEYLQTYRRLLSLHCEGYYDMIRRDVMVVPAKGSTNNTTLWPPLSIDIIRSPNLVWLPFGLQAFHDGVEARSVSSVRVSPWIGSN